MWANIVTFGVVTAAFIYGFYAYYSSQQEQPQQYSNRRRRKSNGNSHKDELTDALNSGTAECIICLSFLNAEQQVFSCPSCRNIFHSKCVQQYSRTMFGPYFPCPLCKVNIKASLTYAYYCMCGQTSNPPRLPGLTPHCCKKSCRKCGLKCHPGQCDSMF